MTWFENLTLSKGTKRLLQELKAYQPGVKYQVVNGQIITPSDKKTEFIDNGYSVNDIIYAVVNIILDKVRLPEWGLYKVVDESSLKAFNSIMRKSTNVSVKDYKKAMRFKDTALQPLNATGAGAGKLAELLRYPNDEETMSEQVANGAGYKLLTGDVFLWGDQLLAGANQGIPNTLELMPSQWMTILATQDFPVKASAYQLMVLNQNFTKECMLHEKYWNPNWSINGTQLYGMSPLKAAIWNIQRNNSAKIASTSKFKNNGMEAIIYPDDIRWTPEQGMEQAAAVKGVLNNGEYVGPRALGKIAASGIKMGAVNLGLSPVELGIIESEKWDAIMFCNIYGVPPELLGLVQKTYNNVVEAEKALTTRSAIPLLTARRNSLNRKIQTDWGFKGQNVYIDYTLECFSELEENAKGTMEWMKNVTAIRPNEERENVGLDSDPDPLMDELWILTGQGTRVPLSDFQANAVDNTLNNANGTGNTAGGNA